MQWWGLNWASPWYTSDEFNTNRDLVSNTSFTSLQELRQSIQQSLISGHHYVVTNIGWWQARVQHALYLLCPCAAVGVCTSSQSWTGTLHPGPSSSLGLLKWLLLPGFMVCMKPVLLNFLCRRRMMQTCKTVWDWSISSHISVGYSTFLMVNFSFLLPQTAFERQYLKSRRSVHW